MAETTTQYYYMAYAVISFVPDKKWTLQTREDWDGVQSFLRTELIQAVLFCSLSGNLKKIIPDLYNLLRSSSPAFFPRTLFFGSEFSKKHQATSCLCQPQIKTTPRDLGLTSRETSL